MRKFLHFVSLLTFAVLSSCLSFGQGLVLPPSNDPWWETKYGQVFIRTYQDLKQCDARTVKNLRVTWPDLHCVKNKIGKGTHLEFRDKLYGEPFQLPPNTVDCDPQVINGKEHRHCTVEADQ
jgi:hypothetical protein